ncbi:MAG: GlcG protein [Micavibrio sp. TMED2]|nr:GlcG protein [Alphaproteobacteria bacterium]MAS47915.1 GlcG protein [Alphaproteobacteria bacterium]MAX97191.1 GlcG protein [Alphaproteobacteria bacterium]OUT40070.1 MAG: GlcG protein [Micavibrio sp. TMED2]|tara:strand:+ start:25464 stop:25892 length:429 start_codon:yes stop_codon:yes gene_type:complete
MATLTLDTAKKIIEAARAKGRELNLKPLTVTVLDVHGVTVATEREDGSSLLRPKVAHGKAYGAISLGIGSRAIFNRAQEQPYFIQSVNALADGHLVPVPGGVLIKDAGTLIGAVGITGDTSDNDEACAIAGIEAVGLTADAG